LAGSEGTAKGGSIRPDLVPAPRSGEPARPTFGKGMSNRFSHLHGER
jgi:hypothetical protein